MTSGIGNSSSESPLLCCKFPTIYTMELHERTYGEDCESPEYPNSPYQGGNGRRHDGAIPLAPSDGGRERRVWIPRDVVRTAAIPLLIIMCIVLYMEPRVRWPGKSAYDRDVCAEHDSVLKLKGTATVEDLKYGAVASDHSVCSELGLKILRDDGGNAVDAAVATALCLGVANPASSGIGGGAFILLHSDMTSHKKKTTSPESVSPDFIDARDPADLQQEQMHGTKVTEVIDCRETAPATATTEMFVELPKNASQIGGLAIAVPGELRGLELAHARHGQLSWAQVVQPAAQLAFDGVPVGAHLAKDIAKNVKKGNVGYILTKNGDMITPLKQGDILRQPELGQTLRAIMEEGADAMYTGTIGKQLATDIQQAGGILTAQDLQNYRATLRSPLIAHDVAGFTLVGVPPPSSGGAAVIGAARFLSGYLTPFSSFADTLSKHRMVEALRHAFAIRMSLSDPAYNTKVTVDAVNDLIRGSYMEQLRMLTLDNDTLPLSMYGGPKWAQLNDSDDKAQGTDAHEGDRKRRLNEGGGEAYHRRIARRFGYLEDHGTSHLSVVDKDRNAVSITSSVNTIFGSGVLSEATGIVLNSQMDDFGTPGRPNYFGLQPSEANFIEPGKKPLSSMSPILVFRNDGGNATDSRMGKIFMALGASGGPKIITSVLQTFLNYAWLGMDLFESMSYPRFHDQLLYHESATTLYEKSRLDDGVTTIEVSNRTQLALERRGHFLNPVDYTGCVQSIAVDLETNTLTAVSDIRKGGMPAGY